MRLDEGIHAIPHVNVSIGYDILESRKAFVCLFLIYDQARLLLDHEIKPPLEVVIAHGVSLAKRDKETNLLG